MNWVGVVAESNGALRPVHFPDKEFDIEPLMVQCLGNYLEPFWSS